VKKSNPVNVARVEELTRELVQDLDRPTSNEASREGQSAERSRASRPDSFRASGGKHAIM
jgi:hypothetical protein